MLTSLLTLENLAALVTLTGLEIVLGIDNIVFLAIVTGKLPQEVQPKARRIGLLLAMGTRIALLFAITLIMTLTEPLFPFLGHTVSGKDLVLLVGGLFLLAKATFEIHDKIECPLSREDSGKAAASFASAVVQIMLIDIVFSLDSVITAVGMARSVVVMATAIVLAVMVMLFFAEKVSAFVNKHPTFQMLALSFLLLIGVLLTAEGLGKHIERGYIYFAMAFSLVVEILNLRVRRNAALKLQKERN
jgi:predicted tellurium resistance membrane protein TerC